MRINDQKSNIFGYIFLLANKLQVAGDHYLSDTNMTIKQWFLMVVIQQFKDQSPSLREAGDFMGMSYQNVKQLALKLEKNGYLSIHKDEKDARMLRLLETEKCNTFWKSRNEEGERFLERMFLDMCDTEIKSLLQSLLKILDNIEKINGSEGIQS